MRRSTTAAATVVAALWCTSCSASDPPATTAPPSGVNGSRNLVVTSAPAPPAGATGPPAVGITSLAPVAVSQPKDFGNGLVATVVGVQAVARLAADNPGDIAAPGAIVTVQLRNSSAAPIDLGGVVVNASYAEDLPASPNDSAPAQPFTGNLPIGASRVGVYAFQVPPTDVGSLQVTIGWNGSANVVIVRS